MEPTTYTAIIGTAADVVDDEFCDVSVVENDYETAFDGAGNEVSEPVASDRVVMVAQDLDVRTDDPDKLTQCEAMGDEVLLAHGWSRIGPWFTAHNAMYAPVEIAS